MRRSRYRHRSGSRSGSAKRSGRSYSSRDLEGWERARKHIEEAHRLSAELGGTDKDVKEYFFNLTPQQLTPILDEYEREHGREVREYAEMTLPRWRSGRTQMSGLVAGRLFKLLPPRMPLSAKYRLTECLWRHVGPSSRKTLRVGLDADTASALAAVRDHIESVVTQYRIPDSLEKRFDWLSAGDVHVKQDLLNHLRRMERELVIEGARAQLPVMLQHLRSDQGEYTHRLAQILRVGKHELEILLDKGASGVALMDYAPPPPRIESTRRQNLNWIWWLLGGGGVVALILSQRKRR